MQFIRIVRICLPVALIISLVACNQYEPPPPKEYQNLTIFHVNDQHGRLENFAKIRQIVDLERQHTNVLLVSAGDIFSGNPVVDNYPDKGYPIIDIMNQTGFDITVIGNHEFDYGEATLNARIKQADFPWICANADMSNSVIDQPPAFQTITAGDVKVTFLGLVETNGGPGTIPSSHPGKMRNVMFQRPENIVGEYADLKAQEGSDVYVALTHLGHASFDPSVLADFSLAERFPYFDLIIGGHTNQLLDTVINNIPVFQAGNNLNYLGKITLSIYEESVEFYTAELINLNTYGAGDPDVAMAIEDYNAFFPDLDEVIGFSAVYHPRGATVGCFYTEAMQQQLQVDWSIQNSGGIRDDLDQGDITKREIYAIDPFSNGTVIYTMTVSEAKDLLRGIGMGLYYSGIIIEKDGSDLILRDESGTLLDDNVNLTLGTNDFIPAVRGEVFPTMPDTLPFTTAEVIVEYLENNQDTVNYPSCNRFFRY